MSHQKGFTLVEMVVVLAIIGLLLAVILPSLSASRAKGRDAAIRAEVKELQTLLEQHYNAYKNFSGITETAGGAGNKWYSASGANSTLRCDDTTAFNTPRFIDKLRSMCTSITNKNSNNGKELFIGGNATQYSVMAYLPYKGTFVCVGTNGTSDTSPGDGSNFSATGCINSL